MIFMALELMVKSLLKYIDPQGSDEVLNCIIVIIRVEVINEFTRCFEPCENHFLRVNIPGRGHINLCARYRPPG